MNGANDSSSCADRKRAIETTGRVFLIKISWPTRPISPLTVVRDIFASPAIAISCPVDENILSTFSILLPAISIL